MAKKNKAALPTAPLFQPKLLRWDDVDWNAVANRPDFQMIGLCNRHVQIDQTGRDWYGMPYLEDEVAAPVQGIPYVVPFRNIDEKELNHHLWQLEFLTRGPYHISTERSYARYVAKQPAGARLWTIEQFYLRNVYDKVRLHILPSPRIARHYVKHWTIDEYAAADAWERENEEEYPHQRKASPVEKFAQLDYVGRVIFALEGLVESCRQRIVFTKLQAEHHTEEMLRAGIKTSSSQAHWARVDRERATQYKQRIAVRRENPEVEFTTAVEQLDMFQNAPDSPLADEVSA